MLKASFYRFGIICQKLQKLLLFRPYKAFKSKFFDFYIACFCKNAFGPCMRLLYIRPCFPFKGNAFDVVTLFEVIEHIPVTSLKDVMKEIKRVLKEGGMLIVTTPNPRNLRNRILGKGMVSAKHEKEYNQTELLELFKDFLKVELSGIYLPLPPLSLLYKPCYRFMWQILFPLAKYCPSLALFTALCGRKR